MLLRMATYVYAHAHVHAVPRRDSKVFYDLKVHILYCAFSVVSVCPTWASYRMNEWMNCQFAKFIFANNIFRSIRQI